MLRQIGLGQASGQEQTSEVDTKWRPCNNVKHLFGNVLIKVLSAGGTQQEFIFIFIFFASFYHNLALQLHSSLAFVVYIAALSAFISVLVTIVCPICFCCTISFHKTWKPMEY